MKWCCYRAPEDRNQDKPNLYSYGDQDLSRYLWKCPQTVSIHYCVKCCFLQLVACMVRLISNLRLLFANSIDLIRRMWEKGNPTQFRYPINKNCTRISWYTRCTEIEQNMAVFGVWRSTMELNCIAISLSYRTYIWLNNDTCNLSKKFKIDYYSHPHQIGYGHRSVNQQLVTKMVL